MKNYYFIICLFIFSCLNINGQDASLIINTKQGKVKGVKENNIFVWKGIPYAQAPIGNLRFKSPQYPLSFDSIYDATQFKKIAPQIQKIVINPGQQTSEDCLYLNVWSKNTQIKKPVMVWIHGGGFYTGSGSAGIFNGTSLAEKGDVVIVTINYRLGALGFLCFDKINNNKNKFDSNLGIKDQVAALKWVKDNIEAFGGDPNNVTIFGQSAGGTCILSLMSCPEANGLFHKAIAESSSIKQYWTVDEATTVTKTFLSRLHISENETEKLLTIPADTLVEVAFNMIQDYNAMIPGIGSFAPTIDNQFLFPLIADSNNTNKVPLLIGTTKNEMNLFNKVNAMPFKPNMNSISRLNPELSKTEKEQLYNVYKKNNSKKQAFTNIATDAVYRMPSIYKAEDHCKSNAPTYMYRFDWSSIAMDITGYKACHSVDLFFVFNTFDTKAGKKITTLSNHKKIDNVSDNIQTAWLNFAKTGNPSISENNAWKPFTAEERATMIFDKKTKLMYDPDAKKRITWETVLKN